MTKTRYRPTVWACYFASFLQASINNMVSILFIPLREAYGLSFSQLGSLVLMNFITQVVVDIGFGSVVDRHGYRRFVAGGHICAFVGMVLFALAPVLFPGVPYVGFMLATVVFSTGAGLLEIMLSPIVDAVPSDNKAASMSLLHSFYAWGQVITILATTFMLFLNVPWQIIVLIWAVLPFVNSFVFLKVPIHSGGNEHRQSVKELLKNRFFIVGMLAIAFGAGAEVVMAQWSSAFFEKGLALPKVVGDVAGTCMFAVTFGVGRTLYGLYGGKIHVGTVMQWGALASVSCYILAALSGNGVAALAACALCGVCVCMLWPGTLSLSSARFSAAGASMFAILAAAGDIGASVGPWATGLVADVTTGLADVAGRFGVTPEQFGLRSGMLLAALFPLGAFFAVKWMNKQLKKQK